MTFDPVSVCLWAFCLATTKRDISKHIHVTEWLTMDTKLDLVISRFVPLGFELMAIGIKANKFSILYSQQKAWYNRTYKSTIVKASNKYCTKKIYAKTTVKYQYKK